MSVRRVCVMVAAEDFTRLVAALDRLDGLEVSAPKRPLAGRQRARDASLADAYGAQAQQARTLLEALGLADDAAPRPRLARSDPRRDRDRLESELAAARRAIEDWQRQREEIDEQLARAEHELDVVRRLVPAEVDAEDLCDARWLELRVAWFSDDALERVDVPLADTSFAILPLDADEERTLALGAATRDGAPVLERALRTAGAKPAALPGDLAGTAAESARRLARRVEGLRHERDRLAGERRRLADDWSVRLRGVLEQATTNQRLLERMQCAAPAGPYRALIGTVPAAAVEQLVALVEQSGADGHVVLHLDPRLGEA
jgi:vacuolar-type H+-ATPase subunit I/STV1